MRTEFQSAVDRFRVANNQLAITQRELNYNPYRDEQQATERRDRTFIASSDGAVEEHIIEHNVGSIDYSIVLYNTATGSQIFAPNEPLDENRVIVKFDKPTAFRYVLVVYLPV